MKSDGSESNGKISWKINGWDMTKAVQRAYGISTGKIKENSRGNER